jgi:dihydroorotate dehydrogenase
MTHHYAKLTRNSYFRSSVLLKINPGKLYLCHKMYTLIRNILFRFDAEKIHHAVMRGLNAAYSLPLLRLLIRKSFIVADSRLQTTIFGLTFPNPVGLAGGFDKNAEYTDSLSCLGFGFVEIGTVTPVAQPGNPLPRLFRLPADKALLNRMGFNNKGSRYAADQLAKRREKILIGGNIGKNKNTTNEDAAADYERCFLDLYENVDFFIVNVSSPNTPGLRELQDKAPLTKILLRLKEISRLQPTRKPILLKIAPDLTDAQLDDIIEIVTATQLDGIVAANTTVRRDGLQTPAVAVEAMGPGGISGAPVRKRATEVVRYLHKKSNSTIPIVACGGIFTAADALEKLEAGASLVQVYTGFVYEGPSIVKKILNGILAKDRV